MSKIIVVIMLLSGFSLNAMEQGAGKQRLQAADKDAQIYKPNPVIERLMSIETNIALADSAGIDEYGESSEDLYNAALTEIMQLISRDRSLLEKPDESGRSALMVALDKNNVLIEEGQYTARPLDDNYGPIIIYLLQQGADVDETDHSDKSSMDRMVDPKVFFFTKMLRQHFSAKQLDSYLRHLPEKDPKDHEELQEEELQEEFHWYDTEQKSNIRKQTKHSGCCIF